MRRLADRLGTNWHVSPLRFKLERLSGKYPLSASTCIEEWLVTVAVDRGFRIVSCPNTADSSFTVPGLQELSNEELAVAMCQNECRDEPQMLRLPAQMISRKILNIQNLLLVAHRERATRVLAELARQALKVDPNHTQWLEIHESLYKEKLFDEPVLHWTRLAEPVMNNGRFNADKWTLVA